MKENIIKEIKKMNGSLLGIGIDDAGMLDAIENSNGIDLCYILSNGGKSGNKKFKLFKKGRTKKINIKKIKKYFRKKSIDNILCDYKVVKKFYKSFVPNSIYVNKEKILIYGNIKELEKIKEKYERYTDNIKIEKTNKSFILTIQSKNVKTNFLKTDYYKIKDTFSDGLDYLTDFLSN